jgi:AhpD family alkylhydroperoxidase
MYDMKKISFLKKLGELAPDSWQGFVEFDKAAMADGAIPSKTKELIAIAVTMTTQCPYCIEIHVNKARAAGCTDAEIAEAVMVAAALRAGAAITHGTHCFDH